MRRLILLALAALATPAGAADRVVQVGSFDRVRVDTPVAVTIVAGSPRATVSGDPRGIEALEVRADTGTLVIRRRAGAPAGNAPLSVSLSTPNLAAIIVSGGARVEATGMKAPRVDLALAGAGALTVRGIDADRVTLTLVGNGRASLAGRAGTARLAVSGAGSLDAGDLAVGDLTVASDGAGEIRAAARYTATIANSGAGQVTVLGTPKCNVRSGSVGPVTCGSTVP